MSRTNYDDDRIDPAERCESEGCDNVAVLRLNHPHIRLCRECWEEHEAVEADRRFERQREDRIFGRD